MKNIEADMIYRLGAAVALVTYIDDRDVLWTAFDRKKRAFPNRYNRSTPRWYFEKYAQYLTTDATVEEIMKAAKDAGCTISADR